MRVILDVVGGPAQGARKVWLSPGQSVSVGRTEQADIALRMDPRLDPVQFALWCDHQEVAIRCLGSAPCLVNGQPVTVATLSDGDLIEAGQTRFQVSIHGAAAGGDASPEGADSDDGDADAKRKDDRAGGLVPPRATIVRRRIDSGAFLYRLSGSPRLSVEVVDHLSSRMPLHIVMRSADGWLDDDLPKQSLFDWLPASVAHASPVVVSGLPPQMFKSLVKRAAGSDALTCVFSDLTDDALLSHLRSAVRGRCGDGDDAVAEHMLLSFEPSLLEERLPACKSDFMEFFFSRVEALLFESEVDGEWMLISRSDQSELVQRLETMNAGAAVSAA